MKGCWHSQNTKPQQNKGERTSMISCAAANLDPNGILQRLSWWAIQSTTGFAIKRTLHHALGVANYWSEC